MAELEKKFAKAVRLKTVKDLEKEYSKELINIYRCREQEKKKDDEFRAVVK
jgi:hypothetical protein